MQTVGAVARCLGTIFKMAEDLKKDRVQRGQAQFAPLFNKKHPLGSFNETIIGFSGMAGDQGLIDSWMNFQGKPMFTKEQIE